MKTLSNEICTRPLVDDMLTRSVSMIGYTVQDADGQLHDLSPVYDPIGFGAKVGEIVESTALGQTVTVVRVLKGYSWRYTDVGSVG